MKPVRDNFAVSPFSDLKELISRNRYKTKRKPYFCDNFHFKILNTKVYNSRIMKRRSSFSMSSLFAINDLNIINPLSMDFLLDWTYIERTFSSYLTLFLKNLFSSLFYLKISKLVLFQLK